MRYATRYSNESADHSQIFYFTTCAFNFSFSSQFIGPVEFPLHEILEYNFLFINREIPVEYTKVFPGKSDY